MLVQLQGREVWYLQLNEAVSRRLVELMQERGMTQYQLYMFLDFGGYISSTKFHRVVVKTGCRRQATGSPERSA